MVNLNLDSDYWLNPSTRFNYVYIENSITFFYD